MSLTRVVKPKKNLSPCVFVAGMIIKRKSGEIPCPLAVEAFAAHLSYICKYDDKYSKYVSPQLSQQLRGDFSGLSLLFFLKPSSRNCAVSSFFNFFLPLSQVFYLP